MHALHQEIVPASGVEYATSLKLLPETVSNPLREDLVSKALLNVVVARSNLLRIFIVFEEKVAAETNGNVDATDPVPGEIEMDDHGEGYVSMTKPESVEDSIKTHTYFRFVREHKLHGIITGLESVRVLSSAEDGLDRLLVSFKEAKVALLEWSDATHDLQTVSIHTYERAPQVMSMDSISYKAELRVDPQSRCAALSLPKDTLSILPFFQSHTDTGFETMDVDVVSSRVDLPYSPSFLVDLSTDVRSSLGIQHMIDYTFLPGFQKPTIAVLFQSMQTWTGRLKEYKDTASIVFFTLDMSTRSVSVISEAEGLPYDAMFLAPCPASIGGVIVTTSNAIIYANASKRIVLPVNGWSSRISDLPSLPESKSRQTMKLEGSRVAFADEKTLLIVTKDGDMHTVEIDATGGVSNLSFGPGPVAKTVSPSLCTRLRGYDDLVFVGSIVGPSVLLRRSFVEEEIEEEELTNVATNNDMELDDDDDIYGPSTKSDLPEPDSASKKKSRKVVRFSICDSIPGHGNISDMTFASAKHGDKLLPQLIAATGSGISGGFTIFQRDFPIRTLRKPHAIGGAKGIWSLSIRSSSSSANSDEPDAVVMSSDATPSPGLSRIAVKGLKNDVQVTTRMQGTTVGAGTIFQRTAILQVMTNAIRVLESDGTERQIIKDMDGNVPRPKIRACCIHDPYVLTFREDDTIGMYVETDKGRIRRKDMSPMGDKSSRYIAGCFFTDKKGLMKVASSSKDSHTGANGAMAQATSTLQGVISASETQWLLLIRPQGVMEIWTLPKLSLVFSTSSLANLSNVLTDTKDLAALSLPQDPPRQPQPFDVEHVLVAPIGQIDLSLHLFTLLRSGHLAIYSLLPILSSTEPAEPVTGPRMNSLQVKFVKMLSRSFDLSNKQDETTPVTGPATIQRNNISRNFIPFTLKEPLCGVFLTGDHPHWIFNADKGGLRLIPSGHALVHSFTKCSLWSEEPQFLLYTEEGSNLLEWLHGFSFDDNLPSRNIPRGRAYSNLAFDSSTSTVIASSSLEAEFTIYDEEGNRVWEPDGPHIPNPVTDCSSLELFSADHWTLMDGYEFGNNEYVNDIAIVNLETAGTESGSKDFIVVGTTNSRGEDLAARGATYVFEIVDVVPDPESTLRRMYKIKLRCKDEAKGPVTAVCGINGYLVSSMGQKIYVRAFDQDERLVGVAFLDVGVYVTSMRVLKNLLLLGDAMKSTWFVAFQEEPYKLVVLGKDLKTVSVTTADFFFVQNELSIITGDEEGVIRLYEYNPTDPDSRDGRYLLLRSEFHSQAEHQTSNLIARRVNDDMDIPQAKLIFGQTNGGLATLTPVEDTTAKALLLLQGQLTRNIQHVAGLNPKALRIVRNDFVSKPLSKGILDGDLLYHFEDLPLKRQDEMTKQIGAEKETILRSLTSFTSPW